MNCSCILVLVIVVIIFAIFICFCPICKSDRVSGGHEVKPLHEVKIGDGTLHIENYKGLKKVLRDKYTGGDKKKARAKADEIVDEIIARMDKTLGYHQKAAFIDDEIMKVINSIEAGNFK